MKRGLGATFKFTQETTTGVLGGVLLALFGLLFFLTENLQKFTQIHAL